MEAIYKISKELGIRIEWILTGVSTNENFGDKERHLMQAHKNANSSIKEATRKLLDIKEQYPMGKSSDSKIG